MTFGAQNVYFFIYNVTSSRIALEMAVLINLSFSLVILTNGYFFQPIFK